MANIWIEPPELFADIAKLNKPTLNHLVEILGAGDIDYFARNKKELVANCQHLLRQRISRCGGGGAGGCGGAVGSGAGDASGKSLKDKGYGDSDAPGGDGDGDDGAGGDDSDPDDEQDDGEDDWDKDVFFGIGIKLPGGELISFLVEANDNLHYVKGIIRNKKGIPRCHQRLTLEGLPVSDDDKVIRGATYEVLMRIAGGVKGVKSVKKNTASKAEKVLTTKFRATTAAGLTSPLEIAVGLVGATSIKYQELMTLDDEVLKYVANSTRAALENAVGELSKMRLQEQSIHRMTCLMPEMVAIQDAIRHLEGVAKALELAFCFSFTNTFYQAETETYDFKRFIAALTDTLSRKVLEEEILAQHGMMG